MFEQILQYGETIEMQDNCDYFGKGPIPNVQPGLVLLTNKRFIICKDKDAMKKAIKDGAKAALFGGFVGGLVEMAITKKGSNEKPKDTKGADKCEFSFPLEDIDTVENGKFGLRKMLVIKTKNGSLCKITVKDEEKWHSALLKKSAS
jgi:hypothetical protein